MTPGIASDDWMPITSTAQPKPAGSDWVPVKAQSSANGDVAVPQNTGLNVPPPVPLPGEDVNSAEYLARAKAEAQPKPQPDRASQAFAQTPVGHLIDTAKAAWSGIKEGWQPDVPLGPSPDTKAALQKIGLEPTPETLNLWNAVTGPLVDAGITSADVLGRTFEAALHGGRGATKQVLINSGVSEDQAKSFTDSVFGGLEIEAMRGGEPVARPPEVAPLAESGARPTEPAPVPAIPAQPPHALDARMPPPKPEDIQPGDVDSPIPTSVIAAGRAKMREAEAPKPSPSQAAADDWATVEQVQPETGKVSPVRETDQQVPQEQQQIAAPARPIPTAPITPADIHSLAKIVGVPSDNSPAFMHATEVLTGKQHLDDLDPDELKIVAEALRTRPNVFQPKEAQPLAQGAINDTQAGQQVHGPIIGRQEELGLVPQPGGSPEAARPSGNVQVDAGQGPAQPQPVTPEIANGPAVEQRQASGAALEAAPPQPVGNAAGAGQRPSDVAEPQALHQPSVAPNIKDIHPDIVAAARADVADWASPAKTGPNILTEIRKLGGVRIRDASGAVTPEGQNILAAIQDYRGPGLINNKTGISPDHLRQILQQDGWFGRTESQFGQSALETGSYPGDDIRALYDAMAETAGGRPVYHPESGAEAAQAHNALISEDMARAGVASGDTPTVAAAKLARYRADVASESDNQIKTIARDVFGEPFTPADIANVKDIMARQGVAADDAVAHYIERLAIQGVDQNAREASDNAGNTGHDIPFETGSREAGGASGAGGFSPDGFPGDFVAVPQGGAPAAETGRFGAGQENGALTEPGAEGLPQTIFPGMLPSDRQSIAARQFEGRGAMLPSVGQKPADEGLFARSQPQTSDLFEPPTTSGPAPEPAAPIRPRPLKPVEGTGGLRTRGLSQGIEAKAIESNLTDTFGDLPEYRQVNMADQAAKATDFIAKDYESAKAVAMGQKTAPKGILPESVLVAVERKAVSDGDTETLRQLATNSYLNVEATTMGQRIRTLAERNPSSPVGAIKAVQDAREAALKARGIDPEKARTDQINQWQSEIRDATRKVRKVSKRPSWDEFMSSITCR